MKETKEVRRERQNLELWTMIDVLRRAGNQVDEQVPLPKPANWDGMMKPWLIDVVVRCGPGARMPIALEIDGIGFSHQGRKGWLRDLHKGNTATCAGYRTLRVTWEMVGNGQALEVLAQAGVNVVATQTQPPEDADVCQCGDRYGDHDGKDGECMIEHCHCAGFQWRNDLPQMERAAKVGE